VDPGQGEAGQPIPALGPAQAFADGSVGSRTALFHEPYADANTTGILLWTCAALAEAVRDVVTSGGGAMGVAVHAIYAAVDFAPWSPSPLQQEAQKREGDPASVSEAAQALRMCRKGSMRG